MRTVPNSVIWIVPAIAYLTIFSLVNVHWDGTVRASIFFLAFSYLMFAFSFSVVPQSRIAPILGIPLVFVAGIYFGIELVAATIFIYAPSPPFPSAIIVQIVLVAIFLAVFLLTISSNEAIADRIEVHHAGVQVIKSAVDRLGALERKAQEPQISWSIERLQEEFRYSPTDRPETLYSTDEEIEAQLGQLESLVGRNAAPEAVLGQISAISGSLANRNSDIKLRP